MVRRVTDMDLQLAQKRGAKATRPALNLEMPEMVELFKHFHEMKHQHSMKHEEQWEKKFQKMDEMIKAIQALGKKDSSQVTIPGMEKLVKLMGDLKQLQVEHAKHEAMEDDDHEPCAYKLTGKRMANGLIDIEHGLTFTPIDGD